LSKKSIIKSINQFVTTNYTKLNRLDFALGDAPFNRKCHLNAVQKVKEGKALKVFLVYSIDDGGSTCVHFINQLVDGSYQDNTWGWLHETTDYYLIKEVAPSEYNSIWKMLTDTKDMLVNLNSSWFHRFIYQIKSDDLV
jgi:hypothetical protein